MEALYRFGCRWRPLLPRRDDDETNKHEANINRLRQAGITFGCTATKFWPRWSGDEGADGQLPRPGVHPAWGRDRLHNDDTGSIHEENTNRLRAAGITAGCNGIRIYCPNSLVTRGSMATFLFRALN
jgi:hypothetical protein